MTLNLQLPPLISRPPPQRYTYIVFYHPANEEHFLSLPKVDTVLDTQLGTERPMLHTKTALSACYIVACNTPGFFAVGKDRATAVKINTEFLDVDEVFYHLEDLTSPLQYPICTEFSKWKFPVTEPLHDWQATAPDFISESLGDITRTNVSQKVKERDRECRTTKFDSALNTCHLVPKAEANWFRENGLARHGRIFSMGINDSRNAIVLRADLQKLFNSAHFVYVPKNGEMRLHFLFPNTSYMQYQNSQFSTRDIPFQFLYARFAWAVFKNQDFLKDDLEAHFDIHGRPRGGGKASDDSGDRDDAGKGSGGRGSSSSVQGPHKRSRQDDPPLSKAKKAKRDDADEDSIDIANRRWFPFFNSDSQGTAPPHLYNNLAWYPGRLKVEELKKRWMADHPNIREVEGTEFAAFDCDIAEHVPERNLRRRVHILS